MTVNIVNGKLVRRNKGCSMAYRIFALCFLLLQLLLKPVDIYSDHPPSIFSNNPIEWKETKLETPSTCFSIFENLYFDNPHRVFFTIGRNINLGKAVDISERRGYSWAKYRHPPQFRSLSSGSPCMLGTAVLLLEKDCTPDHFVHFYHFLEHLVGIWNFAGEKHREDVQLFLIVGNGRMIPEKWEVSNEVTYHLIKGLFPNVEIKTWGDFIEETQGCTVYFKRAITSDRSMERFKVEPYDTKSMLGGYFKFLSADSMNNMASCIHDYCGVGKKPHDKVVVTYIPRSRARWLALDRERELLEEIKALPNVELSSVDFAAIPFREQVNIVANTDVLIGVHGNGLSHTLFLPKRAALIELFPEDSFRPEYRIFAKVHGVDYFGWIAGEGWIDDKTAEKTGCRGNVDVNRGIKDIDIDTIVQIVSSRK